MFALITFSPEDVGIQADIHASIAGLGAERFNLPGNTVVVRCENNKTADRIRKAVNDLRANYVAQGRAFEFAWLRVSTSSFEFFPQRVADRPDWDMKLLRKVFARDQ